MNKELESLNFYETLDDYKSDSDESMNWEIKLLTFIYL